MERGGLRESLPEMGDEVHDTAGAAHVQEGDGGLRLIDRKTDQLQRRPMKLGR